MENLINELNIQDKWNPKKQVTDRTGSVSYTHLGQTALDEDGKPLDVWMLSFTAGSEDE